MTATEIKNTGSHYTPKILADFVAKKISSVSTRQNPRILDPACGDGSLLRAIKKEIPDSFLFGFDLNEQAILRTREIQGITAKKIDFLDYVLNDYENSLFSIEQEKYDIVIANPPYIRTQVLGEKKSRKIAKDFSLYGRIDIYYAFLEGIYRVLNNNGIVGIIISNRFMTVKSGKIVRQRLLEHFDILNIWDFGDTKLFSAAVLPAVLLLREKSRSGNITPKITTIYSTKEKSTATLNNIFESNFDNGIFTVENTNFKIQTGMLDTTGDVWKIKTNESSEWQKTVVLNTVLTFGDIGKVRVGIKTTADKVFVKKNWDAPEPELLKPLVTHDDARRFKSLKPTHSVLYTHEMKNGKKVPVDITKYPISEKYLLKNKEILSNRNYIQRAKRNWYEIWVPQQPDNWKKIKLVFPDISEKPIFWISLEDEIIQGNCYWLISDKNDDDLLWLAVGIGNSTFIEKFYDVNFNNKLYAGRRRFMTQYVEKFPLPNPESEMAKQIILLAKKIYSCIDAENTVDMQSELDRLVYKAFGL